jgi:hypothetical protein
MEGPCLYWHLTDERPAIVPTCFDMIHYRDTPPDFNIRLNECNYLDLKIEFTEPTYYLPHLNSFFSNRTTPVTLHVDFGNWIYRYQRKDLGKYGFNDNWLALELLDKELYKHLKILIEALKTHEAVNRIPNISRFQFMFRNLSKPTDEYIMSWRNILLKEFSLLFPLHKSYSLNLIHSTETVVNGGPWTPLGPDWKSVTTDNINVFMSVDYCVNMSSTGEEVTDRFAHEEVRR